jgi:hypothetical protein
MDEYPKLRLCALEEKDNPDDHYWRVTFDAATETLEHTSLIVEVTADTPEEALRNGRTAMEGALKDLKRAADKWGA